MAKKTVSKKAKGENKNSVKKAALKKAEAAAPMLKANEVPPVDKKLVEWRKGLMAPAERAMVDFFLYPVAKNRMEKEAAKKVMLECYRKGDDVVKQFILFLAHEQLSRVAGLRVMHNFAHFRRELPKEADVGEVRKAVYRSMFNYTTSTEGVSELISFLGEIGDEGAAKLISYHLAYYGAYDGTAMQILRNASVDALKNCQSGYALEVLLNHAKYSDRSERALYALGEWKNKIDHAKMAPEEKKIYKKQIEELLVTTGKEKREYYR